MNQQNILQNIIIYSDGASRGNPGRGGFGAVTIYPNSKNQLRIDEFGGREEHTTNNRMELLGVITALESFKDYYSKDIVPKTILIYTDSAYVIQGIRDWVKGWKKNNWITKTKEPVKNVDLWQRLSDIVDSQIQFGFFIDWIQVPGHAGVAGNERCDEIATGFADSFKNKDDGHANAFLLLYKGFALDYPHPEILKYISKEYIMHLKQKKDATSSSKKESNKSTTAYSYISLIEGKISIYTNWKDCEIAVKGKSGVKFKKSLSKEDEVKIIAEFLK